MTSTRQIIWGILIVVAATGLAFEHTVKLDFVNYDDDETIIKNEHVHGLSVDHVKWMFTQSRAGHYHPLTWLSFAIDYELYGGLDATGFHLTNLLLHLAASIGVFLVGIELLRTPLHDRQPQPKEKGEGGGGAWLAALFAALLFAVHPLRVESVAWVTERRDVLSGAWLLAAVWLYLLAARVRRGLPYRLIMSAAWMAFLLSVLSKAWGMTLPLVLLLLDIYPLGRIGPGGASQGRVPSRRIWMEKAAFAIPAFGAAVAAVAAQRSSGAWQPLDSYTWPMRFMQAAYGLVFYIAKSLWPSGLVPFYGWPEEKASMILPAAVCALLVACACALIWRYRHRFPAVAVAAASYAILVSPVLGLTQSGPQLVADRYTYIPFIPWTLLLGAGAVRLARRGRRPRTAFLVPVAAAALVILLIGLTRRQVQVWSNSRTLWEYHLTVRPECPIGHVNYGSALFAEATEVESLEDPQRRSLLEASTEQYEIACQLRPTYLIAVRGVGRCLMSLERYEEAYGWFQRALALREDDPETLTDVADAESALGRMEEALAIYRRVAQRGGKHAYEAHYEAGRILHEAGRHAEAAVEFEAALQVRSTDATCHQALAECRIATEDDAGAVAALEEALRLDPESGQITARLAFLLASTQEESLRDPPRAMRLAQAAFDASTRKGIEVYESLAAACAANEEFSRAVSLLDEALRRAPPQSPPRWVERLSAQREAYAQNRPLRQ